MSEMLASTDIPVIAIDGPSGAGKGTVSTCVADRLGFHFLDSGALYRLLALAAQRRGVATDDAAALAGLAGELDIAFRPAPPGSLPAVYLDGSDVSEAIRSESVGRGASQVAAIPAVRQALLERQRRFRQPPGLVADGRDMGTVVFPDARLKIFLTATLEERARRRYNQLREKGIDVKLTDILETLRQRDERDAQRAEAPLVAAADARLIDTTAQGIEEVVEAVLALWRARQSSKT